MKVFIFLFLFNLIYNIQSISDSNAYTIERKLDKIFKENEELKKNYDELKNNYDELNNKFQKLQKIIDSRIPVYRLFSESARDHFYCTSKSERQAALTINKYRNENIEFYAFPSSTFQDNK